LKSVLIAHRGEPANWPENSLAGYQAVLKAGARFIETDVQVTADGVPVLSHDPSLLKITGTDLVIPETDYQNIAVLPAGHPEHFGNAFAHLRIACLEEFARLLGLWPEVSAFVELKHASLRAFGVERMVGIVLETLAEVLTQCIFISFEHRALQYCRDVCPQPVGWVLPEWSPENKARALELAPEYLFCNRKRLPPEPQPLWEGPWRWAVYTLDDPDEIRHMLGRGARLVETNAISRLLETAKEPHD
jgi:glycerophosphoryl diester phosphodiesterase